MMRIHCATDLGESTMYLPTREDWGLGEHVASEGKDYGTVCKQAKSQSWHSARIRKK